MGGYSLRYEFAMNDVGKAGIRLRLEQIEVEVDASSRTASPLTIARGRSFGEGPFRLLARASPRLDQRGTGVPSMAFLLW